MHETALLFERQTLAHALPDALHSVVRHPDDVELVHDDLGARNDRRARITVRCPHVHGNVLDTFPAFQVRQVAHHGILVPVLQQLDDGVVLDIGDDASGLDEVDFVNAHPFRRLEADGRLKNINIVPEDQPNGFLVDSNFLRDAGEGVLDGLLADPID